jgi:hypothetical protein
MESVLTGIGLGIGFALGGKLWELFREWMK